MDETAAHNSDQQDCPGIFEFEAGIFEECGFTGVVMRHALDGKDTENGYKWTCPECKSVWDWEGPDPDEYRPRQWDGSADAVVESQTNPWIQDTDGVPFNFGPTCRVLYGAVVFDTNIQKYEKDDRYKNDLEAALGLAGIVGGIHDKEFTVWYNGA